VYFQRFLMNLRKVVESKGFFLANLSNRRVESRGIRRARRHRDESAFIHSHASFPARWSPRRDEKHKEVESACKPGSVRLATRQSFLSARRRRLAPATYPGTTRAALSFPYLVLLRVGFTVPRDVSPACGALLPHPFTLTTHIRRCRSAVCSLLHWPSAHAAQELPGTLPYGARTFLDALACDATARPTPPPSLVAASHVRDVFRGCRRLMGAT